MSAIGPRRYPETIRSYAAVWTSGRTDQLEHLVAADFARVGDPLSESASGREALIRLVEKARLDMPDLAVTIEDLIVEGDRAAIRWQMTGTDTGPGDFDPTGKRLHVNGLTFFESRDGVLTREWILVDGVTALGQLGFTFVPPGGGPVPR